MVLLVGALVFSSLDRHEFSPMCGFSLINTIPQNASQELCDCVHLYRGWLIIYSYVNIVPLIWISCISYRLRKRFSSRREAKMKKRRMVVTVTPGVFFLTLLGFAIFVRS